MFKKWWPYEWARIERAAVETNWLKWFGGGFVMGLVADGARYEFGLRTEHDTIYYIAISISCAVVGSLFGFLFKLLLLPATLAAEQQEKLDSAIAANAELQQQERQFALQQKAIELQNFENSFFQNLDLFKSIRYEVTLKHEEFSGGFTTYHGLECFSVAKNLIKMVWGNRNVDASNIVAVEESAKSHYLSFYKAYREGLSQYFSTLYRIINFVDSSGVLDSDKTKRHYTGLVMASLNDNELFLIFYNGISPEAQNFRPLIEKYGLLERFDKSMLLHPSHEQFYRDAYK